MDKQEIKKQIKESDIDTLRIDFADLHGVTRSKIIPASRLEAILEEGINCAQPTFSLDLAYNIPPGTGTAEAVNYEDMTILPDIETFSIVPYQPHTARFIGDLYAAGKPFPYSPRWLLKNVVEKYNEMGFSPVVASELEFFVFKPDGEAFNYYTDKPSNVYTSGLRSDPDDLMRTLQNNALAMGIDVLYSNHEFFQSQYEINWKHTDAMSMGDQSFTFKSMCKDVAHSKNCLLTFMGRPKDELGGSGFHVHFSLKDSAGGQNLFDDPNGKEGMSDIMRYFIGGQMAHAKAMTLFYAPTINSYKRFALDSFAPYYLAWGLDNRTTYIRVPGERGNSTRVENRAGCASANPYFVIALGLIAGLDGIKNKIDPGDYYEGDVYADESGKLDTVPLYMQDAIEALKKDKVLCEAIGPEITDQMITMKEAEVERYRTHVTQWEFDEYSYHL